ncbi:F-box/FBD/LRR-repeat protein At1g13570-like [Rutidosis leptorrhynchoides]|uniref:F-box/FBD/LRR-repeat protein At1g13570-like n=1 Tax=Rutidosis leptorrhynchoides TaxID=125765 RepID=UPI003A993B17
MTDNNAKRRFVTCTEMDRIINLAENLIDSILEKLPVVDAVRTHVLSKKWRYRWTSIRSLVLDKHFSEKFAKNGSFGHNGFIRITNYIFNYLKGPRLKLHLHIPNMFLDKLRILELDNCIIKPPLEFQGFLYLEKLRLRNIEFGANLHGTIINLPQLKMLQLFECTNVYNFKIKSTKLFQLLIRSCPDATLLHLLHSKCLSEFGIFIKKPIQGVERVNLASLLSNMPCVGYFVIDGYFLQDLPNVYLDVKPTIAYLEASDCLDQTLNCLKIINIMDVERSRSLLLFTKLLLEHSPTLEKISIRPRATVDVQERYNFSKDVMRFPRASSKAELQYLDP